MKLENKIFINIMKGVKESMKGLGENIHCHSFELCYNPLAMKNWFVRFIKADISNPDKVREDYSFFCFSTIGEMLDCSPIFQRQEDTIRFFDSMIVIRKYARI